MLTEIYEINFFLKKYLLVIVTPITIPSIGKKSSPIRVYLVLYLHEKLPFYIQYFGQSVFLTSKGLFINNEGIILTQFLPPYEIIHKISRIALHKANIRFLESLLLLTQDLISRIIKRC